MSKNLVNDFISNLNKATEYGYDKVNIKNKYIEKGYNILVEIDNTIDPIITIKDIFNNNISFDAIKLLAGYLRKYEPILSKKIYLKYNDTMFKYLLMTWDVDQIKIFNQYQNKIEKYNQWKTENKEKYDETMKELNIIIDKL